LSFRALTLVVSVTSIVVSHDIHVKVSGQFPHPIVCRIEILGVAMRKEDGHISSLSSNVSRRNIVTSGSLEIENTRRNIVSLARGRLEQNEIY